MFSCLVTFEDFICSSKENLASRIWRQTWCRSSYLQKNTFKNTFFMTADAFQMTVPWEQSTQYWSPLQQMMRCADRVITEAGRIYKRSLHYTQSYDLNFILTTQKQLFTYKYVTITVFIHRSQRRNPFLFRLNSFGEVTPTKQNSQYSPRDWLGRASPIWPI